MIGLIEASWLLSLCGSGLVVGRLLPKQGIAGSNPVYRSEC